MSIPLYDPRDSFEQMKFHIGHRVTIVGYGPTNTELANVSMECETCGEVLLSFDEPADDDTEAVEQQRRDEKNGLYPDKWDGAN